MQDQMDSAPEAASSFSLQDYAGILRRRRAIILQAFVIVLVAGVLVTLFQAPVYQASGRLLVEPQTYSINSVNTSDPLAELFRVNSQYSIPTQIQLLQSSEMMGKVAAKVSGALPAISVGSQEATSILVVTAEGENPDTVANAINELMKIYVDDVADQSGLNLKSALKLTRDELAKSDKLISDYENKLLELKRTKNIPDLEASRGAAMEQANALKTEYGNLQTEYQVLEARIASTTQQLAGIKANPIKSPLDQLPISKDEKELLDPALRQADEEIAKIGIAKELLKAKGIGEFNPEYKLLDKSLTLQAERREKLARDMSLRMRTASIDPNILRLQDLLLTNSIEASAMVRKLALIRNQVADAERRVSDFPKFEFRYADYQAKLANARARSASGSQKIYDMTLRLDTRQRPARILENAAVPGAPIRPKKAQNILFAGLLCILAGLCLALLQELFDDRINSPEEAERALGLPSLGYIPMIEEEGLRLIRDISTFSPLMESYRTLRTNINFAAVGSDLKAIVITSSVPAEGKSTTCANLAMAMALDGKRVIIVDADLRRPSQHKLFKTSSSPGLTDILVGTHSIDDVMQSTKVEGVSIIPAGSPPPNPAELLGSSAMGHFLANVEAIADIVLFDSPPTLAVADGVVLASRCDGVLLVVAFGETKKANTRQAKEILTRANVHVLGTVMNRMVGPSSGYYYGKYYVPTIDTTPLAGGRNGGNGNGNGTSALLTGSDTIPGAAADEEAVGERKEREL
ncbi:MAG: polysaccharide biosynthesis tyrosine autokinase [Armatimonadota bacterium]